MEFNNLTILLPIIIAGILLLGGLYAISLKTKRIGSSGTRDCPHCKKTVEASATECSFCLRKVVYV